MKNKINGFFKINEFLKMNLQKTKPIFFLIVGGILVVILVIFLAIKFVSKAEKEKQPEHRTYEYLINTGDTFSTITDNLGLTQEQATEISVVSKDVHNLVNIRAGNIITSFFDLETNQFQKLEYHINEDNILVIEFEEGELKAKNKEVEYKIELTKVSGTIESSLYETGQNLGLSDKTIIEMADIFAWDIDFGFDVKKGDNFSLIYEKRFLADQEVKSGKILIARFNNEEKDHWAIYFEDSSGRTDYYNLDGNSLRRIFLRAPLQYKYISSGFTYRRLHPVLGVYTQHTAVDYAAPSGTPVSATGSGTVTYVGWQGGVGRTVIIRHNGVYSTRYSHLLSYAQGIKYGASVSQGQIIGYVGSSGHLSTGPHLEYAMMKYGAPVNPLTQNFEKVEPLDELYREEFDLLKEKLMKEIK